MTTISASPTSPTPVVRPAVQPTRVDRSLSVPSHWNGPRRYGNGGYSAGLFAADLPAARVVLRRPVPLGCQLQVVGTEQSSVVRSRFRLIAEVEALPNAKLLSPPERPTIDEADDAAARYPWAHVRHTFSDCGVCSPHRRDGLGVTPGALARAPDLLAAPFHTDSRLADPRNRELVAPEFVWAALDCPSFPAVDLAAGRVRVLGTIAVTRAREVAVGESLVVVSWTVAFGDRSARTAAALLDADSRVVASAENVWVAPRGV